MGKVTFATLPNSVIAPLPKRGYGFICDYYDVTETGTDLQSFLDAMRDGVISGAQATKVRDNGTKMTARTRIFIVGKRVYGLTYLHLKDMDTKLTTEVAAKFFSSFRLTPSE